MRTTIFKIQVKAIAVLIAFLISNSVFAEKPAFFLKHKGFDDKTFVLFNGKVVDSNSQKPLVFASVAVEGTNIATVTNAEGGFSIKIPNNELSGKIKISYMGYENLILPISTLQKKKNNLIELKIVSIKLTEVNVFPDNPRLLIEKVLENRTQNYHTDAVLMTAFYRETIKKHNKYVGLSEAVVEVYKQPYQSNKRDAVKIYKGRSSSNIKKMDTLLLKLQGGPASSLFLDIVKNPYMILSDDVLDKYDYSFSNITKVDDKLNYVIEFKQNPYVITPLFYGRIYINMDNFAISSMFFSLNTENRSEASAMFVKKKPIGVSVYPTTADYMVKYTEKDGKWYYGYSRGEVAFKVKWKRKLFNSNFSTLVEMAVTDWKKTESKTFKSADRIKMNIIMAEKVNGFGDKDFWGEQNIIEPDKSIESAIEKIKRKL